MYWQAVQRDFSSSPAPSYLVYYRLKAIRRSPADLPTLERFATVPSRADLPSFSSSPPLNSLGQGASPRSPPARDSSSRRRGVEEGAGGTSPQKKKLMMNKEDSEEAEEEEERQEKEKTRKKEAPILLDNRREKSYSREDDLESPGERNLHQEKGNREEEVHETNNHPHAKAVNSSSSCSKSRSDKKDRSDDDRVDFSISFSLQERERIADWLKSIRVNHPDFEIFKSKGILQQPQGTGGTGGGVWGNR